MRQLPLALLACAAFAAATAAEGGAEFAVPCNDDGVAHIPDLPEGHRRPYSVRKRSRTGHRDPSAGSSVTDDTPQLPPGQRRFDAVLPDEQGHDVAASTTARGARHRGQRRLSEDDANEVAASPALQRRPVRRPVRPKKVAELNVPEAEHDAKSDAVVDSYEAVRRYPTHLPTEDDLDDDGNLESNDIAGAPTPLHDQVAQEDVPTASTEQRVEADADLPPGYRSKFPKRTFASDAGGSGDVLRVKPRKHANQYQPPPQRNEQGDVHDEAPATPPPQRRQPASRSRPTARSEEAHEDAPEAPFEPIPATRGPQRYRASHRVRQGSDQPQRSQPARRRPDPVRASTGAGASEDVAGAVPSRQPQQEEEHVSVSEQRPLRRRLRPRPVTDAPDDNLIPDDAVPSTPATAPQEAQDLEALQPVQPQRRPLRRRLRPRPVPVEDAQDVSEVPRRTPPPQRRRRPQAPARTVSEESLSVQSSPDQQRPRGHGRRLSPAPPTQNLPQVEVEHDGTAQDIKTEPTLVRTAVKKVPAGSHGGEPSPALIQKIVKNTLRRLQPQIAEHEGDVGVDILVKIIEVEDR
ncbi:serine/arginine repetitive matrix protein 1-like [Thrips palmi]|uniref:Serine/arginine repetitive matrix protein 1-like n=1 Tax=Thrips palmi TaxID=161013 RepID=A0A6P8ZXN7_THRPL|nr:serine/arginine repetitive matrix protein 1-like [Thrips palmi]